MFLLSARDKVAPSAAELRSRSRFRCGGGRILTSSDATCAVPNSHAPSRALLFADLLSRLTLKCYLMLPWQLRD